MIPCLIFAACVPPPCAGDRLGDPDGTPELVPAGLSPQTGALVPLVAAGLDVDLIRPIQGGHVVFAGAFVRNVRGCGGSLRGELRQQRGAAPGPIIVYDERSVDLEPVAAGEAAPQGGGWGRPPADLANTANIPACPNVQPYDLVDGTFWLQMTYTEASGRSVRGAIPVIPRCRQGEAEAQKQCRCECEANYTIDRCRM